MSSCLGCRKIVVGSYQFTHFGVPAPVLGLQGTGHQAHQPVTPPKQLSEVGIQVNALGTTGI